MTLRPIGIGLIGCGNIGRIHAASLARLAAQGLPIRPVIAADPLAVCREEVACNWQFERLVADPQDVIRDPQVDAIFLCTPTSTRDALLIAILDVRKHLYVEKPLAPTFEAVRKLCHKGAQASVVVQVGFQFRWNSMYAKLQQLIEGREMGLPICYTIRDDECWPTTEFLEYSTSWRSDKLHAGGGPLIEHSLHAIDLACWMFGTPLRVAARTRQVFGFGVEDAAAVCLEHASGIIGSLVTVYHGVQGREERRIEVFFERGVVEVTSGVIVDAEENSFLVQRAGQEATKIDIDTLLEDHLGTLGIGSRPFFWNELASRAFIEAILAGRPASPGLSDALMAHATVEAAYRSATSHMFVEPHALLSG